MEKTAREWLMELKPEHRDLAIESVKAQYEKENYLNNNFKSIHESLIAVLYWNDTNEGFKFWNDIYNKLKSNTYYDEEAKS
jgi:hypothetical protein